MLEFYKILRQIMDEKSIGIPDVARACGLSDGTIRSIIVRKSKNVSLEVAFKLADGLNVSLERLNGMPEKKNNPAQAEADTELNAINLHELLELLTENGFAKSGQDISEDDLRFFLAVGDAIRSWLAKRE